MKNLPYGINLENHPSIHYTGSVKGMIKLGFWRKGDSIVRIGSYYYNLSISTAPGNCIEKGA